MDLIRANTIIDVSLHASDPRQTEDDEEFKSDDSVHEIEEDH